VALPPWSIGAEPAAATLVSRLVNRSAVGGCVDPDATPVVSSPSGAEGWR
jgi:hypothetical protein